METLLDPQTWREVLVMARDWAGTTLLVPATLLQLVAIGAGYVIARTAAPALTRMTERLVDNVPALQRHRTGVLDGVRPLVLPLVWLFILGGLGIMAAGAKLPGALLGVAVSLLVAWVVIRLASTFIRDAWVARAVAVTVWILAALNIVGLLGPTLEFMDSLALSIGELRISILGVLKAVAILVLLLWVSGVVMRLIERRLQTLSALTPAQRVLLGKLIKTILVVLVILVTIESVGIDLTALTIFGGAIGLGLGFGLQKVISNLVSGVILLMDRSVKPGDVIAIGETYGWINSISARYVSVVTRDGIEHLIPNEELISQRVENWSYTDRLVRQRLPFGISYDADPRQAMALAEQAAGEFDRILKNPEPRCLLKGFGDSQVDMELRVWVQDAEKGLSNIKSDIYLRMWDLFKENRIEFPFPQRDVHIKSGPPPSPES